MAFPNGTVDQVPAVGTSPCATPVSRDGLWHGPGTLQKAPAWCSQGLGPVGHQCSCYLRDGQGCCYGTDPAVSAPGWYPADLVVPLALFGHQFLPTGPTAAWVIPPA